MSLRFRKIFSTCVASRWHQFATFLALFFILILLLILAAPSILSSHVVQNKLKSTLGSTLQGAVNWDSLNISWRQGLQVHNLTLSSSSMGLEQVRLAKIDGRFDFGFGANPDESFGLGLFLRLDDLQLDLAPSPVSTSVDPLPPSDKEKLDPLTVLAQKLERFTTLSWPLPIDLRADVVITPLTLTYNDPASGHSLRFAEGDFQFKMPSLERAPLTSSLSGQVAIDGHPFGKVQVATEIAGLITPAGRIFPVGALYSTIVEVPGLELKAGGRLDQGEGVQGDLRMDLQQLQKVTAPFLPKDTPVLGGILGATLQARVDSEQDLALSSTLSGQKLQVGAFGPLDFNLGQQIRTDHRRHLVTLGGGILMIPKILEANWEARIEETNSSTPRVNARLHHLGLDLDQALLLAAPFLPVNLPQLTGGTIELQDLEVQLHGSQGTGKLLLAKGVVAMQSLRHAELTAAGITLAADEITIPLREFFPESVDAGINWQIASIDLRGKQPLLLTAISGVGNLAITAIGQPKEGEKLSASARFDHKLGMASAEATGLASLGAVTNNLQIDFALLANGGIHVKKFEFVSDIRDLVVTAAGKKIQPLSLLQTLQISDVELPPGATFPTVNNLVFSLVSDKIVQVSGSGSLTAARLLTLETKCRMELARLTTLAGAFLPEELTASGAISSDLKLVTTLPEHPLPVGAQPLRSAKNALAVLHELQGSLQLDDVELLLPLANGRLHLSGIQTSQPLRLLSTKQGEMIEIGGDIAFDLRSGSVINGKTLPVEHGQITFTGELRDWESVFLSGSLQIDPLGLAHHTELTITGLSGLLDQPLPPSPATLLQRLDATLFSEIALHLGPEAPQLLSGINIHGKTTAGSRVDLRGGKFLSLYAYTDVENLAMQMADSLQLNGLQAHFNLDRTLKIVTAAKRKEQWLPLSTRLVQPLPLPVPPPLDGEMRRLHDDQRGKSGGERSLTIQSLTIPGLAHPLTIRALEAEIATGVETIGLNYLQAELLGGTLRSRALLDLRPTVPIVSAEALFTNLDLGHLVIAAVDPPSSSAESSISGEGFLRIPLLTEQRPFFEALSLSARLRQVGAKSLDRVLASLDPYERNEAIMAQRKLLRHGQLQGFEVQAADGALALSGAVIIKGASVALPKIERLRLAELPIQKELAPVLAAISRVRPPLEFIRADTIDIDAQGVISLRKEDQ